MLALIAERWRGSASPKGEARRERATKPEGRGGTLLTRVRVMMNYAVGVGESDVIERGD